MRQGPTTELVPRSVFPLMPVAAIRSRLESPATLSTNNPLFAPGCGGSHGVSRFSGWSQISRAISPRGMASGLSRGLASTAMRTVWSSIEISRPRR